MKITFLGAGKMGGAILESLIRTKTAKASQITICETDAARASHLVKKFKIKSAAAPAEALAGADVVFFAVKPQDLGAMLSCVKSSAPLCVSIAAGKKTAWLEAALPPKTRVVRAMPNLALSVGAGMTAVCPGARATKSDIRLATRLFSCAGKTLTLPESQFDAVTALSGSGPAFFAYFLQAMTDAGAKLGLAPETAATLATQTFYGTALVLRDDGKKADVPTPQNFIKAVSSPKGTTAAGIAVLEESPLRSAVAKTLAAAAERGKELSA